MTNSVDSVDRLKPLGAVLERDETWRIFGDRTLEQHHALIEQYQLHSGVPDAVVQHYENAKNSWLYAFFSYRLVQGAILQAHLAGELAVRERAIRQGIDKSTRLARLLDMALEERWLLDSRFEVTGDRAFREEKYLKLLRSMGDEREPFVGPLHEQDYAKGLITAFRMIRNALAHGEVILKPNLGWEFMAIRDLINQLFPSAEELR